MISPWVPKRDLEVRDLAEEIDRDRSRARRAVRMTRLAPATRYRRGAELAGNDFW